MDIIYLLMPMALLIGFGFLLAFIRAAKKGQFDDLETPKHRMLIDDEKEDVRSIK